MPLLCWCGEPNHKTPTEIKEVNKTAAVTFLIVLEAFKGITKT